MGTRLPLTKVTPRPVVKAIDQSPPLVYALIPRRQQAARLTTDPYFLGDKPSHRISINTNKQHGQRPIPNLTLQLPSIPRLRVVVISRAGLGPSG